LPPRMQIIQFHEHIIQAITASQVQLRLPIRDELLPCFIPDNRLDHRLILQPLLPLLPFPLLLKPAAQPAQHFSKFALIDRLENEIMNSVANGLLGIAEIVITANNDKRRRLLILFNQLTDQPKSIQYRHADIGDNQIGTLGPDQLQRVLPVVSFAGYLEAASLPID